MKGVIKQNMHIAPASIITKANVNEDKIVSSCTCVKNVEPTSSTNMSKRAMTINLVKD
jgi:hypothetical protein